MHNIVLLHNKYHLLLIKYLYNLIMIFFYLILNYLKYHNYLLYLKIFYKYFLFLILLMSSKIPLSDI